MTGTGEIVGGPDSAIEGFTVALGRRGGPGTMDPADEASASRSLGSSSSGDDGGAVAISPSLDWDFDNSGLVSPVLPSIRKTKSPT